MRTSSRLIALIIVIFCSLGIIFASPVPVHLLRKGEQLYFPITVGTVWCYQRSDHKWEMIVTEVELKNGVYLVTYGKRERDGKVPSVRTMAVSKNGLAVVDDEKYKFEGQYLRLKLPPVPGEKWSDEELGFSFETLKPTRVKVPAGEFETLRVKFVGSIVSETCYYAKGIGLVKTEYDNGSHPRVLTSFRAGKNGKSK